MDEFDKEPNDLKKMQLAFESKIRTLDFMFIAIIVFFLFLLSMGACLF